MNEITWTVTEPSGEVKVTGKRVQLSYQEALEVNDKTPKSQLPFIQGWNEMRARLIELGEMKQK